MSALRTGSLEARVERLSAQLDALGARLNADETRIGLLSARSVPMGAAKTVFSAVLGSAGLAAAAIGSPSNCSATLLVPLYGGTAGHTATGGRSITVYSEYTTAVGGSKLIYVSLEDDGNYYLVVGDC